MMIDDDNYGQIIFGDLRDLKLPDICLAGEENPEKTSSRKLVPTGDRTQTHCMTGAHAAAWPTEVDTKDLIGAVAFRCLPHLTLSLPSEQTLKDVKKSQGNNMEVRRVDLVNWAPRTSPKFTTGVKSIYSWG